MEALIEKERDNYKNYEEGFGNGFDNGYGKGYYLVILQHLHIYTDFTKSIIAIT